MSQRKHTSYCNRPEFTLKRHIRSTKWILYSICIFRLWINTTMRTTWRFSRALARPRQRLHLVTYQIYNFINMYSADRIICRRIICRTNSEYEWFWNLPMDLHVLENVRLIRHSVLRTCLPISNGVILKYGTVQKSLQKCVILAHHILPLWLSVPLQTTS